MIFPFVPPDVQGLQLDQVEADEAMISVTVTSTAPASRCPVCSALSQRIQSRYCRTLTDLPWAGVAVRLHLRVRRFFCDNPTCRRTVFCERLGPGIVASARRTTRLQTVLEEIGFALGGEAGSRLLSKLALATSPTTLLRMLKRACLPAQPSPRLLGVDDWAWRKGRTYGTILCDLEQHQVVDLLPDRLAETFANWLRAHPGVEVISRDRASGYAEGARAGAPQAIQVADRWHLLKNLSDTLEQLLLHHVFSSKPKAKGRKPTPQGKSAAPQARLTVAQQLRREQRQARYLQVQALYKQGWSLQTIAQEVGIDRGTVSYFVRSQGYPELKTPQQRRRRAAPLEGYLPYLQERWKSGCHNGMQLWREIRAQGYTGSASSVRPYTALLRQAPGEPLSWNAPHKTRSTRTRSSPQRLVTLALRFSEHLTAEEQAELDHFCQAHEPIRPAITLTQAMASMVRQRASGQLEQWIVQAQGSPWPELQQFAKGIADDKAAVLAALTRAESNGQVEGQITRLKLLKRQMYGRAKFELLRQRVLHAA